MVEDRPRVAVIDDHTLFAESLQLALEVSGLEVTRMRVEDDGGAALVVQTLRTAPDAVILDLDLGRAGDGARLIGPLSRGGAAVLVVTATAEEQRWGHCLELGAAGVLVKTTPLRAIVAAVSDLRDGREVLAPAERARLVGAWRAHEEQRRRHGARFDDLTPREREVLLALVHGRRIGEIAASAVVAESTVRSQVKSILSKLGVGSQLAAVSLAHEAGWPDVVQRRSSVP